MKKTIKARPKCGSTNIKMGNIKSGVIYGLTSWRLVCKDCGYKGMPILFNSKEEYKKFLQELETKK